MRRAFLRKAFFAICLAAVAQGAAFSQAITRVAVVDTSRVYQAYYRSSQAVRSYESQRDTYRSELARLTSELEDLSAQKLESERRGDEEEAARLDAQITARRDYIAEYTNAKNTELEGLRNSLRDNNEFYKTLYDTLEDIAESGGYSLILDLQSSDAVLWYSTSIDITNQVISRLGLS